MNIPEIIGEAIEDLSVMSDNVEHIAIVNMLNAKICNMVALAGIRFKQYSYGCDRTLSYYGINFMGSGERKDYTVDNINKYLLPFVREEFKNSVENYKAKLEYDASLLTNKKERDKVYKEIDGIRVENFELANPNYTGLYSEAKQYNDLGFGAIFIRISELGDYLDNVSSGNSSQKELWQKLKEIYEGTIAPNVIAGDGKRPMLENIPVSILLYTDYDKLLDNKIKQFYLSSLKTGIARRSFIYMNTNKDKKLSYPLRPNVKNECILRLKSLGEKYRTIFKQLSEKGNKILLFGNEADELIYQYQCKCIDYFNDNPNLNVIVKNEVKESFWKITKLAVVYSAIDEPYENVVKAKYVEMAIDFYENIKDNLIKTITERKLTNIEKYAEYFYNNRHRLISRTELRKLNLFNKNEFSKTFDNIMNDITDELLSTYNCYLLEKKGDRNMTKYEVVEDKKDDI